MRFALACLALAACCPDLEAGQIGGSAEPWAQADGLFHQEPSWLGGDDAATIDLGGGRTLWLFGDSFIATSATLRRTESALVRNSVAVMTGIDPLAASMDFAWQRDAGPGSFFPEAGDHWFWPSDGTRIPGGPLIVFLDEQAPTPGVGLGFAAVGWAAVRIANPDAPPASWTQERLVVPPAPNGATVACSAVDGDHLVALFVDGEAHHGRLAQWTLADVAAGDLGSPAWWDGKTWGAENDPTIVIDDGATECSLTHAGADGWIYIQSRGFGATSIAMRHGLALTGPWGDAADVLMPVESRVEGAFVYAAKGHASLVAAPETARFMDINGKEYEATITFDLVLTYADNSFTFTDLLDPAREHVLYWPHFARMQIYATVIC